MMKDIGQIVTPELSEVNTPTDILISVAQLQPTERPIEDRYSVNFDPTQSRIIVGVYDGMFCLLSSNINLSISDRTRRF